ncbi:MAG: hypothetical protein ACTSRK_06165 [Promethearchaeota archaeon]
MTADKIPLDSKINEIQKNSQSTNKSQSTDNSQKISSSGNSTPKTSTKKKKPKPPLSQEEEELKRLEKEIKYDKKHLQSLILTIETQEKLEQEYHELLKPIIDLNRSNLQQFFQHNPVPIFAYDIEERYNRVVCFCAVEMFPSLEYKIYIKAEKNIFRYSNSDSVLQAKIRSIFTRITAKLVIAHGNNLKERQLAEKTQKNLINTEICLQKAIKPKNPDYTVSGMGLGAFEEKVGYKRLACKFFKHKWHWKSYFRALEWSFRNFLTEDPPKVCGDCHHPQDVLLYCLEDALVSLFIHVWYENHKKEIDP